MKTNGGMVLLAFFSLGLAGCGSPSSESAVSTIPDFAFSSDAPLSAPPDPQAVPQSGDKHDLIVDNPFLTALEHPRSTFSIDVDTASYSKVRQYLSELGRLPRPDAVRIEELLNYFPYQYPSSDAGSSDPFATHIAVCECPWNDEHRLARVAIKAREVARDVRPASNLVLLVDTSGWMRQANKLPLLKRSVELMVEQLGENDRVAMVAYAGAAGLVLDSTPATDVAAIHAALARLEAGGSTNGGDGLALAYQIAHDHLISGGTNRVLLCTDGDFNVGATGTDQLIRMVQQASAGGVELTVLGFGMGNFNDAMLEQISAHGNGNYAFVDTLSEAKKVLHDQLSGTLVTVAKDVKIQVEFNPTNVAAYRLIGYENRVLENQDFNDDRKDAGEIGAGHTVTALYEIIPHGAPVADSLPESEPLKYQQSPQPSTAAQSGELLTIKLRYKLPGEAESRLLEQVVFDSGSTFERADREFQFAAAVAGFGMLLRDSEHRGVWTFESVAQVAQSSLGPDPHGLRREFVSLVKTAGALAASSSMR